jgi:hypothetical protein
MITRGRFRDYIGLEKVTKYHWTWRVRVRHAAGWVERWEQLPGLNQHQINLLLEFWDDYDLYDLCRARAAALVNQANTLAHLYGPIPPDHWEAARASRDKLGRMHIDLHRDRHSPAA